MFAALLANILDGLFLTPSSPVGTVAGQRIPNVDDREDAGHKGNLVATQAAWIARSIPFFMMTIRNFEGAMQVWDAPEHVVGVHWMVAHDFPFISCKFIRFEQDMIWYAHFANIVKQGAASHMQNLLAANAHGVCKLNGHFSYT